VLVAINSIFQILAYSLLGYFYITLVKRARLTGHDALTVVRIPGSPGAVPGGELSPGSV
jgi:ACR3 family arsenite efflux pump ArsB